MPDLLTALTVPQFADALHITRQTVYNLMKRGEVRSITIGHCRRIPHSELERILAGEAA